REIRRFDDADGCGTPPACLRNGHESGKCPRFGRWGAGLRPALRDAVLAHLGVERRPPQPERRRRRLLVPLRHLEGTQDRHALDLLERADGYLRGRDCRGRAGLGVSALERLGERSEEHTSELQSRSDLVCRLLLEKKKNSVFRSDVPKALAHAEDVIWYEGP